MPGLALMGGLGLPGVGTGYGPDLGPDCASPDARQLHPAAKADPGTGPDRWRVLAHAAAGGVLL